MCCITFNWEESDAMEKVKHFARHKSVAWAVIELTEFCNFNCAWCYASTGYGSKIKRHQMSRIDVKKLIDKLSESGVRQVTYSGGEPTLYPDLKWAVSYAKDKGMIVHMNTNGYLLTRKLASKLKGLGLSQVEINIDSIHPERHDKTRGMEGSFQRAMDALKNANDMGIAQVMQTVITRENQDEIIKIAKLARSIGVHRYRLWDVMPSGEASDKMELRPTKYIDILKELDTFAFQTKAKSIEAGEPLFPLDHKTKLDVIDSSCVCARGLLMNVSARGDAYFCCTYRKPLYNVFDAIERGKVIRDFHKQKLKEFVRSLNIPAVCVNCKLFERCRGGCPTRIGYTEDRRDYWCEMPTS
jgi:radical SAM protein with 4Fe4S-binding SPASM domain